MTEYINGLVDYAVKCGLIENEERTWAFNALLEVLELDAVEEGASGNILSYGYLPGTYTRGE